MATFKKHSVIFFFLLATTFISRPAKKCIFIFPSIFGENFSSLSFPPSHFKAAAQNIYNNLSCDKATDLYNSRVAKLASGCRRRPRGDRAKCFFKLEFIIRAEYDRIKKICKQEEEREAKKYSELQLKE